MPDDARPDGAGPAALGVEGPGASPAGRRRHAAPVAAGGGLLRSRLLPAALLLALLVMQFVDLRAGLHGHPEKYSFFLMGFTALALFCLPWLVRVRDHTRAGRVMLGSSLLLFCWALASAAHTVLPRLFLPHVLVSRDYLVLPLVTAVVTMLGAWGLAAAVPAWRRERLLQDASLLLAATTLLAGPRTMLANHSLRLGTGMGGAAIYHMVLLLALGILLRAALSGERRLLSWAGVAVCTVGILLTGSRAGLLCLVAFVALVALLLALRGQARLVAPLVGGLVVVLGLVLAFVPVARRLLQAGDMGRQANMETALRTWSSTTHYELFGIGSGRMWPWYIFETGHATIPWRGLIQTGFGRGTTNPHSVVLGVLTELGLVGIVLLLGLVGTLVVCFVLAWRRLASSERALAGQVGTAPASTGADGNPLVRVAALLPLVALVASLPAFLFDFYLFKNYAISFWWWFVLACVVGLRGDDSSAADPVAASAGTVATDVRPTIAGSDTDVRPATAGSDTDVRPTVVGSGSTIPGNEEQA